MRRIARNLFWLTVGLVWTGIGAEAEVPRPQWILVEAPAFRAELEPLIAERRADGLNVVIIDTTNVLTESEFQHANAAPLQAELKRLCQSNTAPNYVLLVGSATGSNSQNVVPCGLGTIGRMKGQASDVPYALPDQSGRPTVAVGRFPVRTVEQARAMVEKTLRFENERRPAAWRNRLLLFAGDSGGGMMADMAVDPALGAGLELLHPAWSPRVITSTASRFSVPLEQVHDGVLHALDDGELFSIFLLHSAASSMWLGGQHWITREEMAATRIPQGAGVFFTCGCWSCQLKGRDGEGYGLAAMRNPGGPVAVMGATGESYSAPGLLALEGLRNTLAKPPFPAHLGEYWLAVQNGLITAPMDEFIFSLLDQMDGTKGKVPLSEQRREHLEMWMLLGDPALRLPLVPVDITVDVSAPIRAGQSLAVNGVLPERLAGASVRVTLERTAGSPPADGVNNFETANSLVLATTAVVGQGTQFQCSLATPIRLPWSNVVVRADASNEKDSGLGLITVPVRHE